MPYSIACAQCNAKLKYGDEFFGRSVDCPRCMMAMEIPFPEVEEVKEAELTEVVEDVPVVEEVLEPRPAKKKKKKKKKAESKGWTMPAIAIESGVWKLIGGVVGLLLACVAIWWMMHWPDAPRISDDAWKTVEETGRYKVLFPGDSKTEDQNVMGLTIRLKNCQLSKETGFGAGYMVQKIPPDRMAVGEERILDDSCTGAMANYEANMGGKEIKRTSIKLGAHNGKQLVAKFPGKAHIVLRYYLANGRLYMLMVGGVGLHDKHPDVVKFLNSFEILEKEESK